MKKILVIDIGNTNITCGVFRGSSLIFKRDISTGLCSRYRKDINSLIRKTLKTGEIFDNIIIASVVPLALSRVLMELRIINRDYNIQIIGRDLVVPIKNRYKDSSEVGQDRLVNAYGAGKIYGMPAVIIDFGTAITFDVLSSKNEYLGGLILPGISMSLSGLYRNTALLPKVKLEAARSIIGRDTVNSIRGGVLFGFGAMCDGLILKYKKILGKDTNVILTGGNSKLISSYMSIKNIVDEDLALKSLFLMS